MLSIRGNMVDRQVIESFIKPSVCSNFHVLSGYIIPEDVPSCIGNITKEDTFLRVGDKLSIPCARRLYPSSAAKSVEVG